jgi:aconitase B
LYTIKAGLLTVAKQGKKNIFQTRIHKSKAWEPGVEQAFELMPRPSVLLVDALCT